MHIDKMCNVCLKTESNDKYYGSHSIVQQYGVPEHHIEKVYKYDERAQRVHLSMFCMECVQVDMSKNPPFIDYEVFGFL